MTIIKAVGLNPTQATLVPHRPAANTTTKRWLHKNDNPPKGDFPQSFHVVGMPWQQLIIQYLVYRQKCLALSNADVTLRYVGLTNACLPF